MRICVFGLGYVGCVCAAGFAARGHDVIGVDISETKVDLINRGLSPVIEPGVTELIAEQRASGRLVATTDAEQSVLASEVCMICVGTPSAHNGSLSTDAVLRVIQTIGGALAADPSKRRTVIVRSTLLPGTTEGLLEPALERASGLSAGERVGLATNPEFLREGTSIRDFDNPAKTVVGIKDQASLELLRSLYDGFPGEFVELPIAAAEMAKYVDNAFHAVKITFANEIGELCRGFGLDSHEIMRSFLADTKLNISAAYLTPGFAFGGSCLPKDLRALLYAAKQIDVPAPMLGSVLTSNNWTIGRIVDTIVELDRRRVGLFGLSFKPNTDDLRESPFVELGERLLGKGFDLKIYDPRVAFSQLVGANREYIERRIPHLAALLAESPEDVVEHAEVCVVAAKDPDTVSALAGLDGKVLIDLVRLEDASERRTSERYIGVAW